MPCLMPNTSRENKLRMKIEVEEQFRNPSDVREATLELKVLELEKELDKANKTIDYLNSLLKDKNVASRPHEQPKSNNSYLEEKERELEILKQMVELEKQLKELRGDFYENR